MLLYGFTHSWGKSTNPCNHAMYSFNCCRKKSQLNQLNTKKAETDLLMADSSRFYTTCVHHITDAAWQL